MSALLDRPATAAAHAQARVGLHSDGAAIDAVKAAADRMVGATILPRLREHLAALPSLRRYGVLRREHVTVLDELQGVEVALRRRRASARRRCTSPAPASPPDWRSWTWR